MVVSASSISGALAVLVASAHASGEVLSLLQTQVHKRDAIIVGGEFADVENASIADFLSVQSDKDCKAATKAHRDAKKQAKSDRAAVKAARAALKAALATAAESKQKEEEGLAKMAEVCPVPEIDRSPDVGCSKIIVTSLTVKPGDPRNPELLERGLPADWYGFDGANVADGTIVPGGGIAQGRGTDMGSKLGTAVMQPCSVAWTSGAVMPGRVPQYPSVDYRTGKDIRTGEQVWLEKTGLRSACACREWAETVMKWPEAAFLEFQGLKNGGGYAPYGQATMCRVWAVSKLPWPRSKMGLHLREGGNRHFTCYLGNPEEYKERLANEKALGHVIDKCSKTSLWAAGVPSKNILPTGSFTLFHNVGQLKSPDPPGHSQAGRKLCLKWAKKDPKCANATILTLGTHSPGMCECYESVDHINQLQVLYEPTADHGIGQGKQVCQL